jgi:hypothetical protein
MTATAGGCVGVLGFDQGQADQSQAPDWRQSPVKRWWVGAGARDHFPVVTEAANHLRILMPIRMLARLLR